MGNITIFFRFFADFDTAAVFFAFSMNHGNDLRFVAFCEMCPKWPKNIVIFPGIPYEDIVSK